MDLDLLRVFAAVARTASFSAAARELRIPKSSASRAVARLEEELGVQLLFRTTRQVSLSAAGTGLYDRVAPLLQGLESALGELPEREEEPSGLLRVTAPVDIGIFFLAELTTRYTLRYPAVSVELDLSNRLVDLVAEGFDVALRVAPGLKDSTLVARKASPVQLQLFASPLYLARRGTPRAETELEAHDWVTFGTQARKLRLEGPRGTVEVTPRSRILCPELLFVREAMRAGAGIGLLPSFMAEQDLAAGTLVRVLPRLVRTGGNLYVVSPASRHVPRKVTAFRDLVLELVRSRPLGPPLP